MKVRKRVCDQNLAVKAADRFSQAWIKKRKKWRREREGGGGAEHHSSVTYILNGLCTESASVLCQSHFSQWCTSTLLLIALFLSLSLLLILLPPPPAVSLKCPCDGNAVLGAQWFGCIIVPYVTKWIRQKGCLKWGQTLVLGMLCSSCASFVRGMGEGNLCVSCLCICVCVCVFMHVCVYVHARCVYYYACIHAKVWLPMCVCVCVERDSSWERNWERVCGIIVSHSCEQRKVREVIVL